MIVAETPRLVIRHPEECDIQPIAAIWSDPAVTRFMGGPRDRMKVAAGLLEDVRAETPARFDLWPVIERKTAATIGHCGLIEKDIDGRPAIELVYAITVEAWGKGYATEAGIAIRDHAFYRLGVPGIVALIEPLNAASVRVAEKVGFRKAGDTLRPGGRSMAVYALSGPARPSDSGRSSVRFFSL